MEYVAGYTTLNQADKGQWQANQSTLHPPPEYLEHQHINKVLLILAILLGVVLCKFCFYI